MSNTETIGVGTTVKVKTDTRTVREEFGECAGHLAEVTADFGDGSYEIRMLDVYDEDGENVEIGVVSEQIFVPK